MSVIGPRAALASSPPASIRFGRLDSAVADAGHQPWAQFRETTPEEDAQKKPRSRRHRCQPDGGVAHDPSCDPPYHRRQSRRGDRAHGVDGGAAGMGGGGYGVAKHGVVGIMRGLANDLAPHSIRVNVVHPTAVNTLMATNDAMQAFLATQVDKGIHLRNALPIDMLEPADISAAVEFLLSDDARKAHHRHEPPRRRRVREPHRLDTRRNVHSRRAVKPDTATQRRQRHE